MRTLLLAFLALPISLFAQDNSKSLSVKGSFKNVKPQPEWVYLYHRVNGTSVKDSCKVVDNTYSFSFKMAEPELIAFRVKYADAGTAKQFTPLAGGSNSNQSRDAFNVYTGAGKLRISATDSFSNVTIKGSKEHDAYLSLQALRKPYDDKMKVLYQDYAKANAKKDTEARDRVEAQIDELESDLKENVLAGFIQKKSWFAYCFLCITTIRGLGYQSRQGRAAI